MKPTFYVIDKISICLKRVSCARRGQNVSLTLWRTRSREYLLDEVSDQHNVYLLHVLHIFYVCSYKHYLVLICKNEFPHLLITLVDWSKSNNQNITTHTNNGNQVSVCKIKSLHRPNFSIGHQDLSCTQCFKMCHAYVIKKKVRRSLSSYFFEAIVWGVWRTHQMMG